MSQVGPIPKTGDDGGQDGPQAGAERPRRAAQPPDRQGRAAAAQGATAPGEPRPAEATRGERGGANGAPREAARLTEDGGRQARAQRRRAWPSAGSASTAQRMRKRPGAQWPSPAGRGTNLRAPYIASYRPGARWQRNGEGRYQDADGGRAGSPRRAGDQPRPQAEGAPKKAPPSSPQVVRTASGGSPRGGSGGFGGMGGRARREQHCRVGRTTIRVTSAPRHVDTPGISPDRPSILVPALRSGSPFLAFFDR